MLAHDGMHRRMLAAVLAFAVPAFLLAACNDDPLFEIPVEPPDAPTNVVADVDGADVTVSWTPGAGATKQEVRVSPVVAVPADMGMALVVQEDIVREFEDNTTSETTFTDLDVGAYAVTVSAINPGGTATSDPETFTIVSATTPEITSFTAVDGALVVEWTAIATAEAYHVTLTETDGGTVVEEIADLSTSPTSYTFTAIPEAGVTYTAEVCAVFDLGATEDCGATEDYTYAGNAAPVATITAPTEAAEFFDTEIITLSGSATDAEDGALTGGLLVWDVDGVFQVGTGEELTINAGDYSAGAHVITLTATDTEGAEGVASVNITITAATSAISFAATIQPYFVDSGCTGCHTAGGAAGSIPLDSYDAIVTGTNTADPAVPLIVIGDATQGALIPQLLAVHFDGADDQAYVDDSLTPWINEGAPNN